MKLAIIPALMLSFAGFARSPEIPQIPVPEGLESGAYAEGTVTRLSAEEVAGFLPWAQNARNQLNRALTQARSLPLRERPAHIERAVRAVVERSGARQYQMFLRFALNRGILLVDELERNVDMNAIGSQENALDLLSKAINVGLEFYESDLAFQERAQSGDAGIILPYARFGVAFMEAMYPGVVNVLDSGAQYRLLYKLIEMVNWDLSRDAHAARYAESIVEAHEMTTDLPEHPSQDDNANLRMIRRLNGLRILSPRPDAPAEAVAAPAVTPTPISGAPTSAAIPAVGSSRVLGAFATPPQPTANQAYYVDSAYTPWLVDIVVREEDGEFTMRLNGQLRSNIPASSIAFPTGCVGDVCVDYNLPVFRTTVDATAIVYVVAVNGQDLVLWYPRTSYNGTLSGYKAGQNPKYIALPKTEGELFAGQQAFLVVPGSSRTDSVTILGVTSENKYAVLFNNNADTHANLRGKLGGQWLRSDLAPQSGCQSSLCVGDKAINTQRSQEVEVVGIQQGDRFVIRFSEGENRGKVGAGWSRSNLTKIP